MSACTRVMVVDDSVVARMVIRTMLSKDPDIDVVGVASNGRIALKQLTELSPDLVILDIEMPEMDGLETLREIRKVSSTLPVIMFSAHTEEGAKCVLEALELGASDYLTKPTGLSGDHEDLERVGERMRSMVLAVCRGADHDWSSLDTVRPALPAAPEAAHQAARVPLTLLAIGASTGGPQAVMEVLAALPGDLPVPIVIVQHMPPVFTRQMAERLDANSALTVTEGAAGDRLQPGHALVAPGDHHMTVASSAGGFFVELNRDERENSCRPAVDPLLRSVASSHGTGVLTVILTGMGKDGVLGCSAIHDAGGRILAQDEATSVVWGMPGYVSQAGLAEETLPLGDIAPAIVRMILASRNEGCKGARNSVPTAPK